MSSTRYFQLTPDILLEYNYSGLDSKIDQSGESPYLVDLMGKKASIVYNEYNGSNNFLYNKYSNNYVLPINVSESRFIGLGGASSLKKQDIGNLEFIYMSELNKPKIDSDVIFDSFKLHCTSRNVMSNYDGLIISATIYDNTKNKIELFSNYISRTTSPKLNDSPMLFNQKLYTTYFEFDIISTEALIKNPTTDANKNLFRPENKILSKLLKSGVQYLENSPIVFSVYGVKAIINTNGSDVYYTEKLTSIFVPNTDAHSNLGVNVDEANDGDYFVISPVVNGGVKSFSDYIYNISDERPDTLIIFYELILKEHFTNSNNEDIIEVTHREQYIVNAAIDDSNVEDGWIMNDNELDEPMLFRPVIKNDNVKMFEIIVNMKIINTLDNTTIVRSGSYTCDTENNPNKYGKKMMQIDLGEIPAQVNVYNRRPDVYTDAVKITNSSSNVKIENHQHSIIGFIECANVGVSIEQVPKEVLG